MPAAAAAPDHACVEHPAGGPAGPVRRSKGPHCGGTAGVCHTGRAHGGQSMSTGSLAENGNGLQSKLLWGAVAVLGAASFAILALARGENVSAAWLVVAAVCTYCIAYRFYALWIADKVLGV